MNIHATSDRPIPLRPAPHAIVDNAMHSLTRAAIAHAAAALDCSVSIVRFAEKTWPNDRDVALLLKAPVSLVNRSRRTPRATTSLRKVSWRILCQRAPVPPCSRAALGFRFYGVAGFRFQVARFPPLGFILGEGQPFPVVQGMANIAPTQMHPAKLGIITSLTNEMLLSVNAETLVRQALLESAVAGLDAVLFDTIRWCRASPSAGLLNGATPLIAATGTGADAMATDFVTLANALAPVSGNSPIILIMSPGQPRIGMREC